MSAPRRTGPERASPSPQQLERLIEEAVDGLLVIDGSGVVIFATPTAETLLNRAPGTLPGVELGVPVVGGEPAELRIVRPEGTSVVELRSTETSWDGAPAFLASLRDVTAATQQRARIEHLNAVLQAIRSVSSLLERERDPASLLQGVCRVLIETRGFRAVTVRLLDAVGLESLVVERRCPEVASRFEGPESLTLGTPIESEGRRFGELVLTLPSTVDLQGEEEVLGDLAKELAGALRVLELDEERRQAVESRRLSEAQFHQLFDNSLDAIVVTDAEGRYREVNAAACRLFGYPREELLQMRVGDLHTAEEASADERFRAFLEAGGDEKGLFRFVSGDGEVRIAEYAAFSLPPSSFGCVLRDTTERRSLEEQLQHAQRLDSLGRLAGGVAHDFNNLLTAIQSFGSFALDELPEQHPAHDDLQEVLRAADRAGSLTAQLLAFSRRSAIQPRVTDLNRVLLEMERMVRRILVESIRFESVLAPDLVPTFVDPRAIEQVVMNMVVNARQVLPDGGAICVTSENHTLEEPSTLRTGSVLAPGTYAVITVSDTGPGVPDVHLPHIFEPFFTTKPEGEGTGLGLATCYGIAEQAGGAIDVVNTPTGGARFSLYLPRTTERASPGRRREVYSSTGDESILVVEDDDQVRALAVRSLAAHGYRAVGVASGEEALEHCRLASEPVDLLVTDVIMPQMNGRALVEQLARGQPDMKVLFMSGYSEGVIGRLGVIDPRVALLEKPFTPQSLADRVREVLEEGLGAAELRPLPSGA